MKNRFFTGVMVMSLFALLFSACRKEDPRTTLSFSSFEGGGPEFGISIADETVVSCEQTRKYHEKNHERLRGAGYDVVFSFTGLKPGVTTAFITARSPIADNWDEQYVITVDEDLRVTAERTGHYNLEDEFEAMSPRPQTVIRIADRSFTVGLADTPAAEEFFHMLENGRMEIILTDEGGEERTVVLPRVLDTRDEAGSYGAGDIILRDGVALSICLGSGEGVFTKLGAFTASPEELRELMGEDGVSVELYIEWSE